MGDKVAGTVHGGIYPTKGAFAEYALVQSDLCFKIPEGVSEPDASTFGVAWVTAWQALVQSQGGKAPPEKSGEGEWVSFKLVVWFHSSTAARILCHASATSFLLPSLTAD